MPLQIAQVQVSTKLLKVYGMDLLVQVSEGDCLPKDTSEEEVEEWNALAVIIPRVDPGYGTYVT